MITRSLDFDWRAVEEKTPVRIETNCADAEGSLVAVDDPVPGFDSREQAIKVGLLN